MNSNDTFNKTIMIVEDDPSSRDLMESILTKDGYEVVSVPNGAEMMQIANATFTSRIDLILMDLMMPEKGGFSTIRELQDSKCKDVPVIVVTSRTMDQGTIDIIRQEPNVKGVNMKPFNIEELRIKVIETLQKASMEKSHEADVIYAHKVAL